MVLSIKVNIGELDTDTLLEKCNLLPGQRIQEAIDRSVIEWCIPYCPWRTGKLAMSPYTASVIGSGVVEYDVPYARDVYFGETIQHFSTEINPLAGSFWFDRAMADHVQDVYEAALRAAKGG